MCANAQLPLPLDFMQCFDHLEVPFEYRRDAYPVQDAPVLLHLPDDSRLVPVRAIWGIYPQWAKAKSYARKTYNARSETVSKLPSFRGPWARRQTCLLPVREFYEPYYGNGPAERWAIRRQDGELFCLAGIWETRTEADGQQTRSFSLLTISAESHPVMQRFHGLDDEKRSVVVVPTVDWEQWLAPRNEADLRALLQLFDPEAFVAEPRPRLPRLKKAPVLDEAIDIPAGDEAAEARREPHPTS